MWVKICGNTCVEDALKAAELGADAVGFVFAESSRRVTAAEVRAISEAMPAGVERVGVFGAGTAEEIVEAAREARLNAVQLHGGVDRALAARLRERLGEGVAVIQTLHWTVGEDEDAEREVGRALGEIAREGTGERVLVDARVGSSLSGGTGKSFAWGRAREVLAGEPGLRVIVAGGLRPENVGEAILTLRPWGVDVVSGVESQPGRKDFEKMRRFLENARGA